MTVESRPDRPVTERILALELQVERLVSDAMSEKGTRARANIEINGKLDSLDERSRKMERILYMGMGGLAALQVIAQLRR